MGGTQNGRLQNPGKCCHSIKLLDSSNTGALAQNLSSFIRALQSQKRVLVLLKLCEAVWWSRWKKARERRSLLKEVNPGGIPMCPLMHEGSAIVGNCGPRWTPVSTN